MNGRAIVSFLVGLIVVGILVGVGVGIYNAGIAQGVIEAGRLPAGAVVNDFRSAAKLTEAEFERVFAFGGGAPTTPIRTTRRRGPRPPSAGHAGSSASRRARGP